MQQPRTFHLYQLEHNVVGKPQSPPLAVSVMEAQKRAGYWAELMQFPVTYKQKITTIAARISFVSANRFKDSFL